MSINRQLVSVLAATLLPLAALAASLDPLDSARWKDMQKQFFPKAKVVFDNTIKVDVPAVADNALFVPVMVNAAALGEVREVMIFADFNPIPLALRFTPGRAEPTLGVRIKLQQSTPVRAAARDAKGVWHVGGAWVSTSGGGCTLNTTAVRTPEWERRLNETVGRLWARDNGGARFRFRVIHPMDTGFAPGIPAFYLQELKLADADGGLLMRIEPFEPVSENPVFTLNLKPGKHDVVSVTGRDNNGNLVDAKVTQ